MARRLNTLATLVVLALALGASVDAQGPSDTGNGPAGTPTTPPPGSPTITTPAPVTTPPPGNVPTTTPPGGQPLPTPTTNRPVGGVPVPDTGSSAGDNGTVPKITTPAPSRTTKPPAAGAAVPAVTPATPAPPITPTPPEILIDRQVKSEYGTRAPVGNETISTSTAKSEASKMGSWLVPAVIGAVIISALIIMTFFVRSHRGGGNADEEYATPHGRRGSDNFHELPKTTTHHVNVPVLGDPVKDKVAADQNMRVIAMAGSAAHHSPRANRVASSPPLMAEPNRPPSPGFGTYKQNKHMEGSSVGF